MGLLSRLLRGGSPKRTKAAARKNNVLCARYSVRGTNPESGRTKRVYVVAEATATMEEVGKKSGLLPPYEIESSDPQGYDGPSERQLAYAAKVGVAIPEDATCADATVFLTRHEEGRPLYAPPTPDRIVRALIERNIELPAYAGVYEASNLYLHKVSLEERIAFFAMRVYCKMTGRRYCLLEDAPEMERELFYRFAREYQGDKAFVRSVFAYSGADLPLDSCTISKRLKAYDMAEAYFNNL